jgi:outer membrane receptor protein involved in Fe transport
MNTNLVSVAFLTLLAVSPLAYAIEEIIVTANKREQSLSDVGLAVSALGGEDLKRRRVASGEDLALETPGLVYTPSPSSTPVYTLRGVGFFESSLAAYPDVSLYVDQAPLPFPAMATHVAFDLERAEVLKGPQGTLFGNNATGGAINFIAAKPTDEFSAGFDISYGRFGTLEVEGFVSGPLSDSLRARLAVKSVTSDDWQTSYENNDENGEQDNQAARLILDWDASDDLAFSLNINGWKDQGDTQAPQYQELQPQFPFVVPGSPLASIPDYTLDNRTAGWNSGVPAQDHAFWQLALRTDYQINDNLTLTAITTYAELDYFNNTEADGTSLSMLDLYSDDGSIETFSQELRLANDPGNRLRWVLGANIESSDVDQATTVNFRDSTAGAVFGFGSARYESWQKMDNLAVFGNLEFDISDLVTLRAGIRQTKAERDAVASNRTDTLFSAFPLDAHEVFNSVWGGFGFSGLPIGPEDSFLGDLENGVTGRPSATQDDSSTSWSVGVDYRITEDVLLYANIMQGYKAGSFPHLSGSVYDSYEPVAEESLLDYEVGFKAAVFDGRLSINGAAFFYDYQDKQLRAKFVDPIFGQLDNLTNVPESEVKGAELEVVFEAMDNLQFSASVTYLDTEVKKYVGVVGQELVGGLQVATTDDFNGTPLPFSPEWSYNIRGDYTFSISNRLEGLMGVSVIGQSQTTSVLDSRGIERDRFEIPDYTIVNVNLGVAAVDGSWQLMLWGQNITDDYYWLSSNLTADNVVRYAARPAEYGITYSMNF